MQVINIDGGTVLAMTDTDKAVSNSTPRKRDGDQRRRELCDAAINVLAEHGSRGLTHGQVDRYAAVPDGTTSYYYRTREALLRRRRQARRRHRRRQPALGQRRAT